MYHLKSNSEWEKMGESIEKQSHTGQISLSRENLVLVVGDARGSDDYGYIQIFQYMDGAWKWQAEFSGEYYSEFGWSDSINAHGTLVAVGAPESRGITYRDFVGAVFVFGKTKNGTWALRGAFSAGECNGQARYFTDS